MNELQEVVQTDKVEEIEPSEDTSGLNQIQEAMDKINELKDKDSISPELPQEVISENKEDINFNEDEETKSVEESEDENKKDTSKPHETRKQQEKKLWKERRGKYKALAERDRALAELEELKKERDQALEIGNYHYGQNAYADLEKAELMHDKAIEEGDPKALREATKSMVKATNAIEEIERWNTQNKRITQDLQTANTSNNRPNISSAREQELTTLAQDWVQSHDEINPSSEKYDPQLAQKVGAFVNNLDSEIHNSGQYQYYYTEPYFEAIENHLDKLKKSSTKNNTSPALMNGVGGVKKSYQSQPGTQKKPSMQVKLTSDEKNWCQHFGMTEKEYLKYKIADLEDKKRG